jgi:hypothetical protein
MRLPESGRLAGRRDGAAWRPGLGRLGQQTVVVMMMMMMMMMCGEKSISSD